jgi:glycine betaine/choline ABC-type transport system substrate-binding protein
MMRRKPFLALLALGSVAACERPVDPLQIGTKDFVENQIVGHMMAALVREAGMPVERRIPFGTSAEVVEAVKQGKLDLYLEYTGTALAYTGQAPLQDGDASYARVKELYDPLGLAWLDRLGFADGYALVMRPETAEAQEELPADLIVMASHRPSLKDYLLGPNAAHVARHARCTVYIVREDEKPTPEADGRPAASRAP